LESLGSFKKLEKATRKMSMQRLEEAEKAKGPKPQTLRKP
jgi:hypothetical protein